MFVEVEEFILFCLVLKVDPTLCEANNCLSGQVCTTIASDTGFECDCPFPKTLVNGACALGMQPFYLLFSLSLIRILLRKGRLNKLNNFKNNLSKYDNNRKIQNRKKRYIYDMERKKKI